MANTCAAACVVCDLDGYSNATQNAQPGQSPPGYCTFVVHTMGWVGFVAGSTDLTISVDVGDCTTGNSIEMGIYQTPDCNTFELVSDCNTAMFEFTAYSFTNTVPLTPGCTYYLVFDNNGPAVCPYTVSVVNGSASAPALTPAATPMGPAAVCPGSTATYTVPAVFGACEYIWTAPPGSTINGMSGPVSAGNTVDITFGATSGQVCVRPDNACDNVPPTCLPVTVAPIPPTVLPPLESCFGELVDWIDGNTYTGTQLLTATLTSYLGCDSIVRQQLNMLPPNVTNLGLQTVCPGDCVEVGGQSFCTPGNQQVVLTATNGCDSTIFFNLVVLPTDAVASVSDSITCQQPTVILSSSGSSPGQYSWFNPQQQLIGTGVTQPVSAPGLYQLVVTRMGGGITCVDSASVPVVLNAQLPLVTALGDTIDCTGAAVTLNGDAPEPNLLFTWTGPGIDSANAHLEDPMVDSAGVYILTVLDTLTGCLNSDTAFVFTLGLPPELTLQADTITCAGPAMVQVVSNLSGTAFAWNGPLGFQDTASVILAPATGTYSVTGTTTTGCSATDSIPVSENRSLPAFSVWTDTLTCADTTALAIALGTPGLLFTWTGPNGFSASGDTILTVEQGPYILTATGSNACMDSDTLLVPLDVNPPDAQAAGDTLDCQLLQASLTGNSSTPGATFQWNGPGGFSADIPNPVTTLPGAYLLTVTGPNGCAATATALVLLDAATPNLAVSADTTLSCTITQIGLSAQTNTSGADISWTGPGGYAAQGSAANVSLPGVYLATATGPNGCNTTDSILVGQDITPPDASAIGDTLRCSATDVVLQGNSTTPGAVFSWTGPGGFSDTTAQPVVAIVGAYTLTVTGPNGCTTTAVADVWADDDAPTATIQPPAVINCAQPQTTVAGGSTTTGVQFAWSGPGGFTAGDSVFTTSLPGVYNLVVTAPNGCTVAIAETVSIDTLTPDLQVFGDTLRCANPNALLMAFSATTGVSFTWSGPGGFAATGNTTTVSDPGTYAVVATAPNGCAASAVADAVPDLTIPDAQVALSNVLTCSAPLTTLSLFSNTPGVTIDWTGPGGFVGQGSTIVAGLPGTYLVTTTAPNGCSRLDSLLVQQDVTPPDVFAEGGTLTCLAPEVMLNGQSTTPSVSYFWQGPGGFSSLLPNPAVQTPGVYTLTMTAPNGCTADEPAVVLSDQAPPVVQVPAPAPITCLQPQIGLTASADVAATQFVWTGPGGFSGSGDAISTVIAGAYTVVGTAPNGCRDTVALTVPVDTVAPQITATAGVISCAEPLAALTGTSGTPGAGFSWTGPGGFTHAGAQTQTNIPGSYLLTVTGPNGCSADQQVQVPADTAAPSVIVSGDALLTCTDTIAALTAQSGTAGLLLAWQGPAGFTATGAVVDAAVPGLYAVVATAPNGCTGLAAFMVDEDVQIPDVMASGDTLNCTGSGVSLGGNSGTPGALYAWSGPGGFTATVANPIVSVAGTYTLTVTSPVNGCSATQTAQVFAPPAVPAFSAATDTINCIDPAAALQVVNPNPALTFSWKGPVGFVAVGPTAQATLPGTYTLVATDSRGCSDSISVQVVADTLPPTLVLADASIPCTGNTALLSAQVDPADALLSWAGPQTGLPPAPDVAVSVPGVYTVVATAANGCSQSAQAVVEEETPYWTLELGPDRVVREGDIVEVSLVTNLPFDERQSMTWTPLLGCGACLPQVFLADTSFWLSLAIVDIQGCSQTDSMYFEVIPAPRIYAPNIFYPESDGENAVFQLFAGKGVARIRSLRIFDRWGSQLFEATDFLAGDIAGVWDGRRQGELLNPAVFVWVAEIEGLSGEVLTAKGDVTLFR